MAVVLYLDRVPDFEVENGMVFIRGTGAGADGAVDFAVPLDVFLQGVEAAAAFQKRLLDRRATPIDISRGRRGRKAG